jgi:L-histidine N-alpha-methyltransferase
VLVQGHDATHRYSLIEGAPVEEESFAVEVDRGLSAAAKSIPYRFLYDERGSKLFEEICETPEYYVTGAEREILEARSDEISDRYPERITLAELGSGNSAKTRLLIEAFLRRHGDLRYLPVDISRTMLEESSLELLGRYRKLEIRAIASEYEAGLHHVRTETDRPKLIAWLGSNVGNLERAEAEAFVGGIRAAMASDDRLLIGVDLRKDRQVLEQAYDDPAGATARFSLNLLERINRELGGRFDADAFRHRAEYHEDEGRVEIALESRCSQTVVIDDIGLEVEFAEGEGIHIENAYKYSLEEVDGLAAGADMGVDGRWLDPLERFSLNLMAPAG